MEAAHEFTSSLPSAEALHFISPTFHSILFFISINIKNTDSGARMPGLKSLLHHLLAVVCWANYLAALASSLEHGDNMALISELCCED